MVRATMAGLRQMQTAEQVAKRRGISVKKMFGIQGEEA